MRSTKPDDGGLWCDQGTDEIVDIVRDAGGTTIVNAYPKVSGGKLYLSNNANEALLSAQKISKEHGDEFVSLEHLLIALLKGK